VKKFTGQKAKPTGNTVGFCQTIEKWKYEKISKNMQYIVDGDLLALLIRLWE
jgi:hypothetical protein